MTKISKSQKTKFKNYDYSVEKQRKMFNPKKYQSL